MSNKVSVKLKELPALPGVYFHKNKTGEIIYVGKAAVLKNRVRQYFQKSRRSDPKTDLLAKEISDIDWQIVDSEIEALFLEAEMIRRYMPKYNILLRDDRSYVYLKINFKDDYPSVTTTRRPLDDGATYYGPFLSEASLKRALKYLRRVFPYSTHTTLPKRPCLHYHLGLCPGPETGGLDRLEYRSNLKKLSRVISGKQKALLVDLKKEMKQLAKDSKFEEAAKIRDQIFSIKNLEKQIIFSDKEFLDISKDEALIELSKIIGVKTVPKRIEGYDISHMSGSDTVASMVVFSNGVPNKSKYRKFKSKISGNDDFLHIKEVMTRRFSQKNIKSWGEPELLLIDGGKGQLQSALDVLEEKKIILPVIGLAKKKEQIVVKNDWKGVKLDENFIREMNGIFERSEGFTLIELPKSTHVIKLLQRIRDESHRFAVSYHSNLKTKRVKGSILDNVPGIGPANRKKLIKYFGSAKSVTEADPKDIEKVIGSSKAQRLIEYFKRVSD